MYVLNTSNPNLVILIIGNKFTKIKIQFLSPVQNESVTAV
jgi:hypothetical protein